MTNPFREYAISDLSARIHELQIRLRTHRMAAPDHRAPENVRQEWLRRDHEIRSELHQLQGARAHLVSIQETEEAAA